MPKFVNGRTALRVRQMNIPEIESVGINSTNVARGMNTELDPADIKEDELTLALNCVVRGDKLRRRPGTVAYTVAKPNANKILGLFEYKRTNNINNFIRCTFDSVHYTTAGAWVACAAGVALTGTDSDRFRAIVVNDRFFFTNGVDDIQELDLSTNAYAQAGNWGQYKFLTGFHDRVVAAYLTGSSPNPIEIAWSGIGDYVETDPLVNSSAGVTPLVESSSDFTDFISGIFGFNNIMVVARERSIWFTPKVPSGTNPFNFTQALNGVGSNAPDAIVRVPGGIIFPDWRNEEVFLLQGTDNLSRVGRRVARSLFASTGEPASLFAAYNPVTAEYTIFSLQADDSVIAWKYNLRYDAWTKHEYENISAVANVDNSRSSLTIDELTGTMDGLAVTYNNLSVTSTSPPQELYGQTDGEIATIVDGSNLTDAYGSNPNYSTEYRSKTFKAPSGEIVCGLLEFDIIPHNAGTLALYYSKNDGATWILAKDWTFSAADFDVPMHIKWKQGKRFKRLQWRLLTTDLDFELIEYGGQIFRAGETRSGV